MRWNEVVPDDATVLHLGDLSYRNNSYFKHMIAPHLKGSRKLLISGNHDKQRYSFYRDSGFKIIKPFEDTYLIRKDEIHVSFSHYPLKVKPMPGKRVHIHGHIHNNGYGGKHHDFAPFAFGQINLSVEQTHYKPVNLFTLLDAYFHGCYEPEHTNPQREAEINASR